MSGGFLNSDPSGCRRVPLRGVGERRGHGRLVRTPWRRDLFRSPSALHGGAPIRGSPTTHKKLADRFAAPRLSGRDSRLSPRAGASVSNTARGLYRCDPLGGARRRRWGRRPVADRGGRRLGGEMSPRRRPLRCTAAMPDRRRVCRSTACPTSRASTRTSRASIRWPRGCPRRPARSSSADDRLVPRRVALRGKARQPPASPCARGDRLPPTHLVVGAPTARAPGPRAGRAARGAASNTSCSWTRARRTATQMEFLPSARPAIERTAAFLRKHV